MSKFETNPGENNESLERIKETLEETSHTKENLSNVLEYDKETLKKKLKKAKNVEERIKLFAKITDTFGVEGLVSLIPILGDLTPAIVCTCYLLIEGMNIGLSRKDCLRILGYQTTDVLVGTIPIIGDIADFFFKSNKYSSKIFSEHIEKLKKAALKKGITQKEIDEIGFTEKDLSKQWINTLIKSKKQKNLKNKLNIIYTIF